MCRLWDERPDEEGRRSAAVRPLSAEQLMDRTNATPQQAPEFELECLYDDPSSPSELTVFSPETPAIATEWLTVDRSAAVSLDRMR